MKKAFLIIIGILLWVAVLTYKTDEKAIIFPEEFSLAKEGDTLVVIKSTESVIELGYKH